MWKAWHGHTEDQLLARITTLATGFSGSVGLAARDLATGRQILYNPGSLMPTASVFKVTIMLEVFHRRLQATWTWANGSTFPSAGS